MFEQEKQFLNERRFVETESLLRDYLAQNPEQLAQSLHQSEQSEAWQLLGSALAQQNRVNEAIPAFERAIALSPDDARAHFNLGVALQMSGRAEEARQSFERTLTLSPGHTGATQRLSELTVPITPPLSSPLSSYPQGDSPSVALPTSTYTPYTPPSYTPAPGSYIPPPQLGQYGQQQMGAYGSVPEQNTSGMGQTAEVPVELQNGWNWGAFYFSWIWLVTHGKTGLGVGILVGSMVIGGILGGVGAVGRGDSSLTMVTTVLRLLLNAASLGLSVWLGIAGNKMGWQSRRWQSVADFRACQAIWARWALWCFIAGIIIFGLLIWIVIAIIGSQRLGM
jgi:hypothetical protein